MLDMMSRIPMPRVIPMFAFRVSFSSVRFLRKAVVASCLLFALLLAPVSSLAQDGSATLSGRVLDVADGSPVAFATLVVENAESEPYRERRRANDVS